MDAAKKIGIAVVEYNDHFLIGVRGEGAPLSGLAEFPGGKCQKDETPAACAIRECREESGLEVQVMRLLDQRTHSYPHGTVELHFWLCEPLNPESVAENHQGFRWVHREELSALHFPEANQDIVGILTNAS